MMKYFCELEKYYEREPITEVARSWNIWRVPMAKMETTRVLEYEVNHFLIFRVEFIAYWFLFKRKQLKSWGRGYMR